LVFTGNFSGSTQKKMGDSKTRNKRRKRLLKIENQVRKLSRHPVTGGLKRVLKREVVLKWVVRPGRGPEGRQATHPDRQKCVKKKKWPPHSLRERDKEEGGEGGRLKRKKLGGLSKRGSRERNPETCDSDQEREPMERERLSERREGKSRGHH